MLKTILSASAASALALAAGTAIAQTAPGTGMPNTGTTAQPTDDPLPTPAPNDSGDTATTTTGTAESGATTNADTTASVETPAADTDASTTAAATTPAAGTIAAAVAGNAELSSLGGALTAANLTATLSGPGPYTVFAPTNAAFDLIPADTRTALMQPANQASLATILKFHVVAGNVTADALKQQIEAGNGSAQLQTVAGQTLTATLEGGNIVLTGQNNSKAYVTLADQRSSNGTVHVVNGILVPRLG